MLLEQPTNHKSLIQKLNQHFEASTGPPTYFDFETKCTKQGLHCEFPITLENAIFIKTRNGELCNEVIQKNGKLKMVRETAKAFRIAKQGNYMITSGNSKVQEGEQLNAKDRNKLNKITRPGQHSMRNSTPDKDTSRPKTKLCCIRCGNTAHPKGGVCKNCIRCGGSNHLVRVCPSRKPSCFGKQVRALEPNESCLEEGREAVEEVYRY